MLPFLPSSHAYGVADITGGKDEPFIVQFVRSRNKTARLAVATGLHLGLRPDGLTPRQQDLFSKLTHPALVSTVDQAVQAACDAIVIIGPLFAEFEPSLEHVRSSIKAFELARKAHIPVIVVHDQFTHQDDGIDFLCDLGYVEPSVHTQHSNSIVAVVGRLTVAIRLGTSGLTDSKADLTIGVISSNADAARLMARIDRSDDLLIDARTSSPGHSTIGTTPIIEPGRAGPPVYEHQITGFTILDLENEHVTNMAFSELKGIKIEKVVLEIDQQASEQLTTQVARKLEPYIGTCHMLYVELRGPISRSDWHALDPSNLISWSANQDTLLQLNILGLDVDPSEAHQRERPSFLVSSRRAADQLATAATNDADRVAIAEARDLLADVLGRRTPVEPVR